MFLPLYGDEKKQASESRNLNFLSILAVPE